MRLVDADALYKKLNDIRKQEVLIHGRLNNKDCCTLSTALFEIECAPTIEPEIVRCKDCKHRIEHKHYGDLGESAYTCEGNMDGWILPDGFCSLAERRTDETD